MRRTILIIHPGSIGDVLLSLPAMRGIQQSWGDHDLGLIAQGEVGRLLLACDETQEVFPIETQALSSLLAGEQIMSPAIRSWLAVCDLAVCWMADPENRLASALEQAGVRRAIIQSALSSVCLAEHQEDRLQETVHTVARSIHGDDPLILPPRLIAEGKATLKAIGAVDGDRPIVVLHPGSGARHKCGDPAIFAEVFSWCRQQVMLPILVGGPADEETVQSVADLCRVRPAILRCVPLLSMAGVLAHASLFIGHDSGLTHLAARLHRPVVALFGPTDPARWAPRGEHVDILSGETCQCESWDAMRACPDKPCLRVPVHRIIRACEHALGPEKCSVDIGS